MSKADPKPKFEGDPYESSRVLWDQKSVFDGVTTLTFLHQNKSKITESSIEGFIKDLRQSAKEQYFTPTERDEFIANTLLKDVLLKPSAMGDLLHKLAALPRQKASHEQSNSSTTPQLTYILSHSLTDQVSSPNCRAFITQEIGDLWKEGILHWGLHPTKSLQNILHTKEDFCEQLREVFDIEIQSAFKLLIRCLNYTTALAMALHINRLYFDFSRIVFSENYTLLTQFLKTIREDFCELSREEERQSKKMQQGTANPLQTGTPTSGAAQQKTDLPSQSPMMKQSDTPAAIQALVKLKDTAPAATPAPASIAPSTKGCIPDQQPPKLS